jgi:hypothetical protein
MGYTIQQDATPHRKMWSEGWTDFAIDTREDQNDTMHRSNNNDATHILKSDFTKRQTNTTYGLNMPRCLEDGSAWEPKKGAASRDTASGRRMQP